MTLGAPLGLLALLALGPIVAAYFLRRKQPPRVVSALFLWKEQDQRAEAGPKLERFSREASLALETLAVLFAALFLADAQCGASAPRRQLVVVVDGSLSMRARVDGTPVSDRVKSAIAALARREGATTLTIVETGPRPTVLAGPQLETTRALSALEAWQPAQPAHDLGPALAMARELAGASERLFYFTDGPLPEGATLPPRVEAHSLGRAAPNVGFLSAQRHDAPVPGSQAAEAASPRSLAAGTSNPAPAAERGQEPKKRATVTVRVGNFSDVPATVPVTLSAPDDAPQTQTLTLAPGGTAVVRANFLTAGPVTVTLPDDALPDDGHLTLLPAPLAPLTVGLLEGLDPTAASAIRRLLAVAPAVSLAPDATLTFGPPGSGARVTFGASGPLTGYVGPFFALKSHPLFDDVQLGGVVWTAGPNPPGRALLSMGAATLVSEDDDGAVHFNVDLSRSNLQRTVAWPVLLGNVLRLGRLGTPGLPRRHLMLGEEVPVVAGPGASWELVGPSGQRRPVLGEGALTLPPLPAPGRWELRRDGTALESLEVLPLDPHESDLRGRGPWDVEAERDTALASLGGAAPRALWPVFLMLLVLLADFVLTAARPARAPRPSGAPGGAR